MRLSCSHHMCTLPHSWLLCSITHGVGPAAACVQAAMQQAYRGDLLTAESAVTRRAILGVLKHLSCRIPVSMSTVCTAAGRPGGLQQVKHVIAVSSCKGGVGKSTTAVNLAYTLLQVPGLGLGMQHWR
jgi:Mrp family chromosome partitioning ATPase